MTVSVSVIGIGRLGGALAIALSKSGYHVRQLISHQKDISKVARLISTLPEILSSDEFEKISTDIIFITTPDAEIQSTAEKLTKSLKHKPFVYHTSGALSSEILQAVKNTGSPTGSIHPLVSISDPVSGADNFKNVFFCVEGELSAVSIAEKIVTDLGGKSFSIPTKFKTLYHASAVMTSGHLVALFSMAVETLQACGLDKRQAQNVLFPLLESTIKNLAEQSPAEALTGTFSRADVETLKRHLKTLRENVPADALAIYLQLGRRSLHLAEQQGADVNKLSEMKKILIENGKVIE